MKYVSIYGSYKDQPGEDFTLPSETVPNQAYPLSELLRRAAMGLPVNYVGVEYDEEATPDGASMEFDETNRPGLDLTDFDTLKQIHAGKPGVAASPSATADIPAQPEPEPAPAGEPLNDQN